MAGSRTRYYTVDEVHRIVMDVPNDSDISDFEGEDGDDASDMFEPSSDSDDLDNSERAIEHEDNSLDQSSDGEGEARRNETTTSTRGRSSGKSRGRPRGGRVRGTTTRRVRSRSPVNRGSAEGASGKAGNRNPE